MDKSSNLNNLKFRLNNFLAAEDLNSTTKETFLTALKFIDLLPENIKQPEMHFTQNIVDFIWDVKDIHIELCIFENKIQWFYIDTTNITIESKDSIILNDTLPEYLLSIFKLLF